MSRRRRVVLAIAVVLLLPVIAVAALVLVAQSEWGARWVEARLAAHLHREVHLEGISFGWGWPPAIHLAKLRIANPAWASTPVLVDADNLYGRVMILPLFHGKVVVPYVGARKASAGLEMDGERRTWSFSENSSQPSSLQLGLVYLDDGHIVYRDRGEKTDLAIAVKGTAGAHGMLEGTATGTYQGEPAKAHARIPDLDPQHLEQVEVDGDATIGATAARAKGSFAADASTLDLRLDVTGHTLEHLGKLTGMVLPDTPPYKVSGRLRHAANDWIFDPFAGKIGDSDIGGALTYAKGRERPLLKASLKSKLLDFNDLGPLVGAPPKTGPGETANATQESEAARRSSEQRILPDRKFATQAWGKMDADVTLEANRVLRPKQLPIDGLKTHLKLNDAVMRLEPLDFSVAEGHIAANILLDGREKPMRGEMKADIQGLHLAPLFPTVKGMQDALGTLYGRADLKGRGDSVAALLGTSDGKMTLAVDGGRIRALLDALIPLQLAEVVMLLGKDNEQVALRCAVAGLEVTGGVARPDSFVVDTEHTLIKVHGTVDFGSEALAIEMDPYPKQAGILSLRTPILVDGPLRTPHAHPKAGPIAARVAAATALAAVNPALALLATLENGPGKDTDCGKALAEARASGAQKKLS